MISVQNLSVRFGGITAVRNVSFSVKPGESFGLVGESGSGKSTVLRCISGLNRDWSGEIEIDGLNVKAASRRDFARHVQMVFQDPYASLHPRFVIGQTIAEPMKINGRKDADARAEELLSLIGLGDDFRSRFPHELSGGQRQRVAIARALALEPKILLLDEPTSALDVSVQAEILNLLNRLRHDLGLTFVIVSHDLAVISYMCDRLAVMRNAEPVEILSRRQLRERDIRHAYTRQLVDASETVRTSESA